MTKKQRYNSVDGLRGYSALAIIMMHMLSPVNNQYELSGIIFETIIPSWTNLVFLFMSISAFSMCCGYYEKFKNGTIQLEAFYKKRFSKILPFFAILVFLDLVTDLNQSSIVEAFADITLMFGLLPNANISVIGVGWFLGVVFLFYMIFPFFCFLCKDKRSAWVSLGIAVIYNIVCAEYFMDTTHVVENFNERSNILFCAMYFMAGGVIFLYKEQLESLVNKYRWCVLGINVLLTGSYIICYEHSFKIFNDVNLENILILFMCSGYLIYAIGTSGVILNNKVIKFISGVSMEIYLCHMMIFRIVERLHLNYLFGNGLLSYIVTVFLVIIGAVFFSLTVRFFVKSCNFLERNKRSV